MSMGNKNIWHCHCLLYVPNYILLGIAYVQMFKPSEAALAIEEMNGKFMPNNPKPIRVNTNIF